MLNFWKWSLLVFLAARSSEVVQSVIGLWLVPKYVPAGDVGAVLPMTQSAIMLSLPLTVLMVPASRWLAIYTVNGEAGKLKSLLRWTVFGSVAAGILMTLLAGLCLPGLFRAARVSERGFFAVMLLAGALGAVAPVFNGALQGLSKFGTVAVAGFSSAALRLLVTAVLLPLRTFTGYLAGMAASAFSQIVVSGLGLRRELAAEGPSEPFWKTDGRAMMRYAVPVVAAAIVWNSLGTLQTLLIRTRLPEVESGAFFIITRFGDVGCWFGNSVLFVAFPFVAAVEAKGGSSLKILERSLWAALVVGGLVALAYWPLAGRIMSLSYLWRDYAPYAANVPLWTLRSAMGAAIGAFMGCEQAAGRFRYLAYLVPCVVVESLVLFVFSDLASVILWLAVTEVIELALIFLVIRRRRLSGR